MKLGDGWYPAYPYVPTQFENPSTVPRLLQFPIGIDLGYAYALYSTYREYQKVYGDAVGELQRLIQTELDSPPSDSTDIRELAMLTLQLDTDRVGSTGIAWESRIHQIISLRREISGLMQELGELQHQIKRDGNELAADLSDTINDMMQEYWIDGSQLDPEPVPTKWPDDETGQSGVYIGKLPHRPQPAPVSSDGEDGEREENDSNETDRAEEQ